MTVMDIDMIIRVGTREEYIVHKGKVSQRKFVASLTRSRIKGSVCVYLFFGIINITTFLFLCFFFFVSLFLWFLQVLLPAVCLQMPPGRRFCFRSASSF